MIHRYHTMIAKEVGTTAASIFYHIAYWVKENQKEHRNYYDDRYWVYGSIREMSETTHSYLTENQIRGALDKLVKEGFLDRGNYNRMKYDRTYWYTLTPKAEEILQKIEMLSNKN